MIKNIKDLESYEKFLESLEHDGSGYRKYDIPIRPQMIWIEFQKFRKMSFLRFRIHLCWKYRLLSAIRVLFGLPSHSEKLLLKMWDAERAISAANNMELEGRNDDPYRE